MSESQWETALVPATDPKADLSLYLQLARDALLWKLTGLSEYDVRRPLTTTGTNLLGLVKHATAVELGYLCATFGRSTSRPLPWGDTDAEPGSDHWATSDESREQIIDQYRQAWTEAESTIDNVSLDTIGRVPWWPADDNEVTLHHALVRVIADTHRHAGHADILREQLDGSVGMNEDNLSTTLLDTADRDQQRARLERIASLRP